MNEKVLAFLRAEIAAASGDRLRNLKAIEGYLLAAKGLRQSFDRRDRYSGDWTRIAAEADRFDLDCARVSP
jgi:hypothetical protein